jgi:hypothetical protein
MLGPVSHCFTDPRAIGKDKSIYRTSGKEGKQIGRVHVLGLTFPMYTTDTYDISCGTDRCGH